MKFAKGMIIGTAIAAGITLMCSEGMINKKRIWQSLLVFFGFALYVFILKSFMTSLTYLIKILSFKVTLIKPKYCRSTNNKTNHAKYCEIGAKSIYLANKKLNRGKYYYEAQLVTENNSSTPFNNIGLLSDSSRSQSCFIDSRSNNGDCNGVEIFTWQERGKLKHNDVIGLFVDFDNNKINYSRNGVMNKTPVTFSYLQSGYAPAFEVGSNSTWIINFGERNFKYNKPAGYNTLNKKEAL